MPLRACLIIQQVRTPPPPPVLPSIPHERHVTSRHATLRLTTALTALEAFSTAVAVPAILTIASSVATDTSEVSLKIDVIAARVVTTSSDAGMPISSQYISLLWLMCGGGVRREG